MSLPIEFVEKYKNLLGEEESSRFFTAIDSPSKKGFRLNPLKNNYQDIQYSLKEPIEFTKACTGKNRVRYTSSFQPQISLCGL